MKGVSRTRKLRKVRRPIFRLSISRGNKYAAAKTPAEMTMKIACRLAK